MLCNWQCICLPFKSLIIVRTFNLLCRFSMLYMFPCFCLVNKFVSHTSFNVISCSLRKCHDPDLVVEESESDAVYDQYEDNHQSKTQSLQRVVFGRFHPESGPRQRNQQNARSVDFSGEEIDMIAERHGNLLTRRVPCQ